ncbi:hypothetical protein FQN57_000721 [Myotisia sp. PD_48]|nr:hypothetical protein FQN57_000721 [Myotisia sp. PD_48]
MRSILFILGFLCAYAFGHIEMNKPYPLHSKFDPKNGPGNIDYSNTSPLRADGGNFPCKKYHVNAEWRSVATYAAGGSYSMSLAGSATHGGGSCQLSLSTDNGQSFKVILSMMGGCPLTSSYSFQIPTSVPSGKALFAWSWFNKIGNREMYMNCAQVEITGGATDLTAWNALPDLFIANIQKGCSIREGVEAVFANPGEKVIYGGSVTRSSPVNPVC